MTGQATGCVTWLCEGQYNPEWPKCGWCKNIERCKSIQQKRTESGDEE